MRASPDLQRLCHDAIQRIGARCFDNFEVDLDRLEVEQAILIADRLIDRGGREAFLLGRQIRDLALACR